MYHRAAQGNFCNIAVGTCRKEREHDTWRHMADQLKFWHKNRGWNIGTTHGYVIFPCPYGNFSCMPGNGGIIYSKTYINIWKWSTNGIFIGKKGITNGISGSFKALAEILNLMICPCATSIWNKCDSCGCLLWRSLFIHMPYTNIYYTFNIKYLSWINRCSVAI